MVRLILTDAQWAQVSPFCLGKKTDPVRTGGDGRMFLEAVLGQSLARPASRVRQLEHGVPALPLLGRPRCLPAHLRSIGG